MPRWAQRGKPTAASQVSRSEEPVCYGHRTSGHDHARLTSDTKQSRPYQGNEHHE